MFLLFLIGLGTAGVKAQVRIGGNTAPSASAVLDLNASDAANLSTGGLVLPRVDLKNSTMQLTTGVANQTGTMVYNVTTTLGRIGVYYWNANSWVLASLPSTSNADSGKFLMSTGSGVTWSNLPPQTLASVTNTAMSATTASSVVSYTFNLTGTVPPYSVAVIPLTGARRGDFCFFTATGNPYTFFNTAVNTMNFQNMTASAFTLNNTPVKCVRFS